MLWLPPTYIVNVASGPRAALHPQLDNAEVTLILKPPLQGPTTSATGLNTAVKGLYIPFIDTDKEQTHSLPLVLVSVQFAACVLNSVLQQLCGVDLPEMDEEEEHLDYEEEGDDEQLLGDDEDEQHFDGEDEAGCEDPEAPQDVQEAEEDELVGLGKHHDCFCSAAGELDTGVPSSDTA
jgi:hypothetical protein